MTAVLAGVLLAVGVILLSAPFIRRCVGEMPLEIQTRIFGILLAGIAAQLILEGISGAFPALGEMQSGQENES
jgi:small neutral amino acid transporter SnatA (MarC family)